MVCVNELSREELISTVLGLQEQLAVSEKEMAELLRAMATLEKENAELRARVGGDGGASTPGWVKPNRKERRDAERKARKKRAESFSRKRQVPTEVVYHAVDTCPDCHRKLSGGWEHDRRQVVDLPDARIRVRDNVRIARRCGICGKRWIPKLELSGQVVDKCSFGVGLMSVIAAMSAVCRMPYRTIQRMLGLLYGVKISVGEIVGVLHKVSEHGEAAYEGLLGEIRGSPVVNADETGWREDGVNGYIWSFSTPNAKYFLYDHSRGSKVVKEVLCEEFEGALVTDFYAGYNVYEGVKQRCWVHLLRDLKELASKYAWDKNVRRWVKAVKRVYYRAKKVADSNCSQRQRVRWRQVFEEQLLALAMPYLSEADAPQRVLSKRIDGFLGELFTFVDTPGVPSENNAAERAVRPAVIARKISGGTRSPKGSVTKMRLMSLFQTWSLQNIDPVNACKALLTPRN